MSGSVAFSNKGCCHHTDAEDIGQRLLAKEDKIRHQAYVKVCLWDLWCGWVVCFAAFVIYIKGLEGFLSWYSS